MLTAGVLRSNSPQYSSPWPAAALASPQGSPLVMAAAAIFVLALLEPLAELGKLLADWPVE